MKDKIGMDYWFPLIEKAGLPVPKTRMVTAKSDLTPILDGEHPYGWDDLIGDLVEAAGQTGGFPTFLRTSHGSGKHQWGQTCFVREPDAMGQHVYELVEWSHMVDMFGLPHEVWAVREFIDTKPLFSCRAWEGCPINREFRIFTKDSPRADGFAGIEAMYFYWPAEAIDGADPDAVDWRERLEAAQLVTAREVSDLTTWAREADWAAGGGGWSVDFLQGADGRWWLTDMAPAEVSYRPNG